MTSGADPVDVPVQRHPIVTPAGPQMCEADCPEFADVLVPAPAPAQGQYLCHYHAAAQVTFFAPRGDE
jgi:hypothetical protein